MPSGGSSFAFPNPADHGAQIDYQLPVGLVRADLVLHAMNGQEVKRISLTGTSGRITLTTSMLPAGTYTYQIVSQGVMIAGQHLVVVH